MRVILYKNLWKSGLNQVSDDEGDMGASALPGPPDPDRLPRGTIDKTISS